MKSTVSFLLMALVCGLANAAELRVSSNEPVVVTAPDHWTSLKNKLPSASFSFETFRIQPPANRNVICLVSIIDKDKQAFAEPEFLKKLLRADSRPYVNSANELSKVEIKELKITGGLGFYANFVDPDL